MAARVVTVDARPVAVLAGELDLSCAREVRAVLMALVDATEPGGDLHVDLAGVSFCDSSGLIPLVAARKRLGASGGRLVLISPQPAVLRTLLITGLHKVFEIRETSQPI